MKRLRDPEELVVIESVNPAQNTSEHTQEIHNSTAKQKKKPNQH